MRRSTCSIGVGAERKKRLQWVVYYRAGDETGELYLEEWRER